MPAQSVGVKGAESIRDLGHKFILQIKFQNKIKKVKFSNHEFEISKSDYIAASENIL